MTTSKKLNISFILDETGSMYPYRDETVAGFNKYLRDIKKERKGKPTAFTLTLFNTLKMETRYDGVPLAKVKKLNEDTYVPDAWTPLYDAIGQTVRALEKSAGKKGKALVVIFTDGEENSSTDFSRDGILKLIEEKQADGWAFVYLGSNQNAWRVGTDMGIKRSNISTYKMKDTDKALNVAASATMAYAASGGDQIGNLISNEDIKDLGN